ncbi:hypothetical protein DP57_6134 [Burkholderia pseudomallei]|nr:hypothetical protein DP57_6134 [Burkholderia pseudomallei]
MRSMRFKGFRPTGTQDSESLRRGCFCPIGSCFRAAASPLSSSSRRLRRPQPRTGKGVPAGRSGAQPKASTERARTRRSEPLPGRGGGLQSRKGTTNSGDWRRWRHVARGQKRRAASALMRPQAASLQGVCSKGTPSLSSSRASGRITGYAARGTGWLHTPAGIAPLKKPHVGASR